MAEHIADILLEEDDDADMFGWIGFSENASPVEDSPWKTRTDGKPIAEDTRIDLASEPHLRCQRVEDNAFHLCAWHAVIA